MIARPPQASSVAPSGETLGRRLDWGAAIASTHRASAFALPNETRIRLDDVAC